MFSHYRVTALPTTSPIDLTELKDHLRIFGDDSVSDDYLEALITTAVDIARSYIGEGIGDTEIDSYYTNFTDLCLPHRYVEAITSVQYYNTSNTLTTVSSDDYYLDNSSDFPIVRINDDSQWPADLHRSRSAPVVVNYDNNIHETVSSPRIEQAILMICSDLYDEPSSQVDGRKSQAHLTAERLLKPFQKRRLGV